MKCNNLFQQNRLLLTVCQTKNQMEMKYMYEKFQNKQTSKKRFRFYHDLVYSQETFEFRLDNNKKFK